MLTLPVSSALPDEVLFAKVRSSEFARLDGCGESYLDYTGAALYPESLVRTHAERLLRGVYGNPHSEGPASRRSTALVEEAREAVLRFLDADASDYEVCFTANASAAIRLVAESFPFEPGSRLLLSADNHNSVNGIREHARARGAAVEYLPLDDELRLDDAKTRLTRHRVVAPSLFALPAQSNFSGVRHPLALVGQAREAGFVTLLDAAAFLPTSALSLRALGADFVVLSCYKLFGYPAGTGALVARREALAALRRPWFAGGTVEFVSVQGGIHALRRGAEGFEDGTLAFLALGALPDGFAFLERIGMARTGRHVAACTVYALDALDALLHPDGRPLVERYGPRGMDDRAGTVAFNLRDRNGAVVPYELVERAASRAGVSLRGGCFCNPGAAERAFGFPAAETVRCLESLRGRFDPARLRECMGGRPAGALRLSVGIPTTTGDIDRAIAVLAEWRGRALES